jgi:hypothetical protein
MRRQRLFQWRKDQGWSLACRPCRIFERAATFEPVTFATKLRSKDRQHLTCSSQRVSTSFLTETLYEVPKYGKQIHRLVDIQVATWPKNTTTVSTKITTTTIATHYRVKLKLELSSLVPDLVQPTYIPRHKSEHLLFKIYSLSTRLMRAKHTSRQYGYFDERHLQQKCSESVVYGDIIVRRRQFRQFQRSRLNWWWHSTRVYTVLPVGPHQTNESDKMHE